MSAHVLLNLSNELVGSGKMRGLVSILLRFSNELMTSVIQEQE